MIWVKEAELAPRQHLMRVTLVGDIPDYLVVRRIKDVMVGNGQFHRPEVGPDVTANCGIPFQD